MFGIKVNSGRSLVGWVDELGKRFRKKAERKVNDAQAQQQEPRTEAERSLAAAMGWAEDPWRE